MKKILFFTEDKDVFKERIEELRKAIETEAQVFLREIPSDSIQLTDINEDADCIFIATGLTGDALLNAVTSLNDRVPDIPVVVLTVDTDHKTSKELLKSGASKVISYKANAAELLESTRKMMEVAEKGHISGVGLSIALQMMELERKTCTLTVKSGTKKGLLFFRNGELIDAQAHELTGQEAAMDIVTWENTEVSFRNFCKKRQKEIQVPLAFILLESSRQMDESSSQEAQIQDMETSFKSELEDGPQKLVGEDTAEGILDGLDELDFEVKEARHFDVEAAMEEGPLADDLKNIKKALLRAIGPVGNAVFKAHCQEWAKDNEPSRENLNQLIDLLCVEIEDEDLIRDFREELGY